MAWMQPRDYQALRGRYGVTSHASDLTIFLGGSIKRDYFLLNMDTRTAGRRLYLIPSWKPSDPISKLQIGSCRTDFSSRKAVPLTTWHFKAERRACGFGWSTSPVAGSTFSWVGRQRRDAEVGSPGDPAPWAPPRPPPSCGFLDSFLVCCRFPVCEKKVIRAQIRVRCMGV